MLFAACGEEPGDTGTADTDGSTGALSFFANGEDFVREGFYSRDGWHITFRHLYITVSDVTAFQTDPPYDPETNIDITAEVTASLDGTFTVDLAPGEGPVALGTLDSVPAGLYNALSWNLVPASSGPSEGYSIYIDAQAEKDDQSYNVLLGIEQGYSYRAGEYVGDERKGIVTPGGTASLEMTFHLDHIFGDMTQPADCALNTMATGFEPFALLMQEGTVQGDIHTLSLRLPEETYTRLFETLQTLGHTGEGHCNCTLIR
jgi:hypothetical protein